MTDSNFAFLAKIQAERTPTQANASKSKKSQQLDIL